MDEHLAQVYVAAFADAQQPRLASSGILPWHDSQPRSKVASLPKGCAVADGGNDGRGHDRPNPWNLPDASTTRIGRPRSGADTRGAIDSGHHAAFAIQLADSRIDSKQALIRDHCA